MAKTGAERRQIGPRGGCIHTEDLSRRKSGQVGLRGSGQHRARVCPFALAGE